MTKVFILFFSLIFSLIIGSCSGDVEVQLPSGEVFVLEGKFSDDMERYVGDFIYLESHLGESGWSRWAPAPSPVLTGSPDSLKTELHHKHLYARITRFDHFLYSVSLPGY